MKTVKLYLLDEEILLSCRDQHRRLRYFRSKLKRSDRGVGARVNGGRGRGGNRRHRSVGS